MDLGSSFSQISGVNKIWAVLLVLWLIEVLKTSPLPLLSSVVPSRIKPRCQSYVENSFGITRV